MAVKRMYYGGTKRTYPYKKAKIAGRYTVPRATGAINMTETKYFDSELTLTDITAVTNWSGTELDPDLVPVASINTLVCPKQGNDINQRIGRRIAVKGIRIRGVVRSESEQNQTATDYGNLIRIILCIDQQTNGSQMNGEDLMQDPVTNSSNVSINSFQNLQNLGRFRVLKDKTFTLNNPAVTYDGTNIEQNGLVRHFKWNIGFKNRLFQI
jgi:hypothetical protein